MSRTHVDARQYLFASDVPSHGMHATVAVHWSAFQFAPTPDLLGDLKDFLTPRVEVSEVWFVAPADCAGVFKAIRQLDEYKRRASVLAGLTFRYFTINRTGQWIEDRDALEEGLTSPIMAGDAETSHVATDGMRQLFRDTHALVSASAGFHFERPGRGHSEHFIRTSRAIARSQHAYFVAVALLRWVSPRTNMRLIADTAGILPILAALKDLWRRLGSTARNVTIDSFGGYEGIEKHLSAVPKRDFVVISSSTSGSLAEQIIERRRARSSQICTIFYLGQAPPSDVPGYVLCDLSNRDARPVQSVRDARVLPYSSFRVDKDGCELCDSGSHPIELAGDEFFPTSSNLELRMPSLLDRPFKGKRERASNDLRRFDGESYFEDFYGLDAITSSRAGVDDGRRGVGSPTHGVTTRISHIFDTPGSIATNVRKKIDAGLRSLLTSPPGDAASDTIEVSAVISLGDLDSRALGRYVAGKIFEDRANEVAKNVWRSEGQGGPSDSLDDALNELPRESLVIVCAGVIGSGRALLNLSRSLRKLPDDIQTAYLIAAAHSESSNAQTIFRNSLGVRSGTERSQFRIVWELPREPGTPGGKNPWVREREVLGKVEGWLDRYREFSTSSGAIQTRLSAISTLSDDNLFASPLIDIRSSPVMPPVNPKFALWPFEWSTHSLGRPPTQPEVFSTVAHLMFSSRRATVAPGGSGASVRRHGFALNPAIFDRFNEPQIQSAILRTAEPGELHYQSAVFASRAAADVVMHVLENATLDSTSASATQSGGSAAEFLISLCSGLLDPRGPGMRMADQDMQIVLRRLSASGSHFDNFPPLLQGMLLYIEGLGSREST